MTYLQHNEAFLGTGEKNSAGQTLEEFLEAYNPKKYDNPCNTVDIAVFQGSWKREQLTNPEAGNPYAGHTLTGMRLLMIRRGNHPNIGFWALPGGFVEIRENLADAARRELQEETGVTDVPLSQLGTWGDYDRDPRWRVITTLYAAVIDKPLTVKGGDDAADALWFDVQLTEVPIDGQPESDRGNQEPDRDKLEPDRGQPEPDRGKSEPDRGQPEPDEESAGSSGSVIKLRLTCCETDLALSCEAFCHAGRPGTLEEDRYELSASDRIAGDHGLMIIDAVRKIYQRTGCER